MRALVYTEPSRVELREVSEPEPGPDDVLVAVSVCGICGSDIHGFQGKSAIRVPPAIMGHELVGTVAGAGRDVQGVAEGQRVTVQPVVGCGRCDLCLCGRPNICPRRQLIGGQRPGGFAARVAVPAGSVYPLPREVSDVAGALVEPLANAVHMVEKGRSVGGSVVIVGAGTLGVLAAAVARRAGYRSVVVADIRPEKLSLASQLGATSAVHIDELNGAPAGADLVIEAVGVEATRRAAITAARPGATVVLLGNAEAESGLPVNDIVSRELLLAGSYSSTDAEFRTAIQLLADGLIETESWTRVVPLEEGPASFKSLSTGRETAKVLLRP